MSEGSDDHLPAEPGGEPSQTGSAPGSLPDESGGESQIVENVAAALRADTADLDQYHRVLSSTLGDLLPAGMVEVDFERSLGDRVAGRPGKASAIRLRLGDAVFELTSTHGRLVAAVVQQVRGVTIARREIPVAEWVRQLAAYLAAAAAESASAREALEKLLGA
ncbi:MAG TPA: hypothetical protein VKU92_10275 [Acidimicrobiales bacterium]|nr:hypothetical protein [Acidimicrobiales bacterium]